MIKAQVSTVAMVWHCVGLAKYGRAGAERRASFHTHTISVKCDECRSWHLIPTRVNMKDVWPKRKG